MSNKACMEELVRTLRANLDLAQGPELVKTIIANYAPALINMGVDMDQLYDDNKRMKAIVNLIELKNERDELARKLELLEAEKKANG